MDLRAKKITRDRKGLIRIMIKTSVHQEDIAIIKVYAPKNRAAKYVKQVLTEPKGKTDKSTIIGGDFNNSL